MKAFISEIYPTVQGEGPQTGEHQIFVRLAGCPLRCDYCDTPASLVMTGHPHMEMADVLNRVQSYSESLGLKSVSITGGEPLVQVQFLEQFLPLLKKERFHVYLETAGIHAEALEKIIQDVDVISMDMKMPSATGKILWDHHRKFLQVAGKKAFVKIVLEQQTHMNEFDRAVQLMSGLKPQPQLILQPVHPHSSSIDVPDELKIDRFFTHAQAFLGRVRLMKQKHKEWGLR